MECISCGVRFTTVENDGFCSEDSPPISAAESKKFIRRSKSAAEASRNANHGSFVSMSLLQSVDGIGEMFKNRRR